MLATGEVPVKRGVLPEGEAGVDETVKRMVRMAHDKWGVRSAKVRALAINIINQARVADKDYYGMIVAIHNWVRDRIRYVRDPVGQETLSHPEETLFNSLAGDCDDKTIAEIALLGSLGISAWPVVTGKMDKAWSHVYLRAQVPTGRHRNAGMVIGLDPIMRQWPAGQEAPLPFKKEYPQYAQGPNMSGLGHLGIGAYADAPDYLPGDITTDEVGLMSGGKPQSLTTPVDHQVATMEDGTVANTAQVDVAPDGVDGLFGLGVLEPSMRGSGERTVPQQRIPVPRSAPPQISSDYTAYGQIAPKRSSLESMPRSKYGPLGPMNSYGEQRRTVDLTTRKPERLGPQVKSLRARKAGGRIVGNPQVTVSDTNLRADPKRTRKHLGEELAELTAINQACTALAGDLELAGMGADIGKGWDDVIVDAATLKWLADQKAALLAVIEKHFADVEGQMVLLVKAGRAEPGQIVKAQEQRKAAKAVADAAQAVAVQAGQLVEATTPTPAAQGKAAAVRNALAQAEQERQTTSRTDALPPQVATEVAKAAGVTKPTSAGTSGLGIIASTSHVRRMQNKVEKAKNTGHQAHAYLRTASINLNRAMQMVKDYEGLRKTNEAAGFPSAEGLQSKLAILIQDMQTTVAGLRKPFRAPQVKASSVNGLGENLIMMPSSEPLEPGQTGSMYSDTPANNFRNSLAPEITLMSVPILAGLAGLVYLYCTNRKPSKKKRK